MASHLGTAIGQVVQPPRPQVAQLPVSLPPRPALLAGREQLLAELDARLSDGHDPWPRVVALHGLGGVGKTTVAVEYAHRHLAEVGLAWQFPAEDPELLLAEFARLAAQLGAREVVDARDPLASVQAVLAAFPVGSAVEVPVLSTEVAASFLVNRTGKADERTAEDLARELDGLPLALEQAAAYIQAAGITLAEYLSVFRDRRADMLARGEAAGHPADVAATLGLALSRLGDMAPAATGLAQLLACLAPEPVPLALLLADAHATGELAPGVAATVGPLLGDPVAVGDAVAALRRYSLVTPAGDGLVSVHPLVQAVTADQMSPGLGQAWRAAAAAMIEIAIPANTSLPESWLACAALLPHARAVLDLTSEGMWRIANYLGSSGNYPAARDLYQLIADAHAQDDAYGPEHRDTLTARGNLARWAGIAGGCGRRPRPVRRAGAHL